MARIIAMALILGVVICLYLAIYNQDLFLTLFSSQYHLMHKIRDEYRDCFFHKPPYGKEYFINKVATMLNENTTCSDEFKGQITDMLSVTEFYNHYFSREKFDITCYREMLEDYKTGDYTKHSYNLENEIIPLLPRKIASCPQAVRAVVKMIQLGMLDNQCHIIEKSPENRTAWEKNEVYFAAQKISAEYKIKGYDKVFGELWGVSDSTIRNSILRAMDGGSDSEKDKERAEKRKELERYIDIHILNKSLSQEDNRDNKDA